MRLSGPRRIVVVGGGVAAHRCAFELRARGFDGSVTVVSAETAAPYDRTLLSKDFLCPATPDFDLALSPGEAYREAGIDLRLGLRATGLDTRGQQLILSHGERLPFDRLVICTGGRPRVPPALACPGILTLRELRDAAALRATLADCRRLAIVGGGFIGGEVAASAAALGVDVTIVEALSTPLAAVLGTEVGARVAALHRACGVNVLTSAPARGIHRRGPSFEIALDGGRALAADAVVVGAGMAPAVEWLQGSPLRIEGGVITDSTCRTNVPNVFAAGDCARWWNPRYGTSMRVEHWDTASCHGVVAAASALGAREPFAPVPFFWSCQHGVRLQWAGYAPSWDRVDVEDIAPPRRFVARYHVHGRLVAVFSANQPRVIAATRREMQAATMEEAVGWPMGE